MCKVSEEKNGERRILSGWSGGVSEKTTQIGRNVSVVARAPQAAWVHTPKAFTVCLLGKKRRASSPMTTTENSAAARKAYSISQ